MSFGTGHIVERERLDAVFWDAKTLFVQHAELDAPGSVAGVAALAPQRVGLAKPLLGGAFVPCDAVPREVHQSCVKTAVCSAKFAGVIKQFEGFGVVVGGAQAVFIAQAQRSAGLTVPVGAGALAVGEGGVCVYGIGDTRDLGELPARGGFFETAVLLRVRLRVLLRVRGASLAALLWRWGWQAREHRQQQHGVNIALTVDWLGTAALRK